MRRVRGKSYVVLALAIVMLASVLSACSAPATTVAPTTETAQPTEAATQPTNVPPTTAPTQTTSPLPTATMESPLPTPVQPEVAEPEPTEAPTTAIWAADGIISADEYNRNTDFGDMRLWWRNDDNYLYIAMEGDTSGWVSVGIDPENAMQGANYLFGYVVGGEAQLWDAYGTAPRGANHPPDEDLGGTNDIVAFVGTEEGGVTRFEVQIPLDSGDAYDKPLQPGQTYPLIIAIGGQDDFNAYHLRYDIGELALD